LNSSTKKVLALVVAVVGVVLIIGGIVSGKHGATVVGIIISGVAIQQYIAVRKKADNTNKP
jgi:hypothetical protein